MPQLNISKSILIHAPVERVYAAVRDFKSWRAWSPWLIAEPDCRIQYATDGRGYSWNGRIVGAGNIEVTREDSPRSIHCRLEFLKPWKSASDVAFHFAESDGTTEVTWTMNGSLPFFLFFMKSMMTAFLGMDFQRGLNMLKDYAETGEVPSQLEFVGRERFSATAYVGVRTHCAVSVVGPTMEADLVTLREAFDDMEMEPDGKPFAIYHAWDPVKGETEYTLGLPVAKIPAQTPDKLVTGSIPTCDVHVIRHTGAYRHLGNAWAAGMMRARTKIFAQNKKIPPFEFYENDPRMTPENELLTVLRFPVK